MAINPFVRFKDVRDRRQASIAKGNKSDINAPWKRWVLGRRCDVYIVKLYMTKDEAPPMGSNSTDGDDGWTNQVFPFLSDNLDMTTLSDAIELLPLKSACMM